MLRLDGYILVAETAHSIKLLVLRCPHKVLVCLILLKIAFMSRSYPFQISVPHRVEINVLFFFQIHQERADAGFELFNVGILGVLEVIKKRLLLSNDAIYFLVECISLMKEFV